MKRLSSIFILLFLVSLGWSQNPRIINSGGNQEQDSARISTLSTVAELRTFANPDLEDEIYVEETGIIYKYFPTDTRDDNEYSVVENGLGAFAKIGEGAIDNEWEVFIWWGQSNSMGRDSAIAGLDDPHPRVYELTRGNHGKADKQILVAENPMNFFDNNPEDMSPALEFGREIQQYVDPTKNILIIPMSEGGYQIKFMQKYSDVAAQGSFNHYNDMLDRLLPMLESPKFKLRGMYFQQGESDISNGRFEFYENRFLDMFSMLKNDLNTVVKDFPIFLGNVPYSWAFSDNPNNNRDELFALNEGFKRQFPDLNIHYIKSDGLQQMADQVHYKNEEYRRLGVRIAKKVAEQVYGINTVPEKPIVRVYPIDASNYFIEWSEIYTASDEGLTDVKVLVNGIENVVFSNLITDHNEQTSITVNDPTLNGATISIVAVNQYGDSPASDAKPVVFTATVPTPNRHYNLDETTGTTVVDAGTDGQNGTLTTDASNLTATFADAELGFDFDGTNTISIPEIRLSGNTPYTICWDMEDVGLQEVAFGDASDATFNYFSTFSTYRLYFNVSSIVTPDLGGIDNSGLNTYCVCSKEGAVKLYRNAIEISPSTYFVNPGWVINTIGDGLGSPAFYFKSKLKDFRLWDGVFLNPVQMENL